MTNRSLHYYFAFALGFAYWAIPVSLLLRHFLVTFYSTLCVSGVTETNETIIMDHAFVSIAYGLHSSNSIV